MRNWGLSPKHEECPPGTEICRTIWTALGITLSFSVIAAFVVLAWLASMVLAWPRDLDGKYAGSPLKPWFDQLASGNGLCCSFADGRTIDDPDIDMTGDKCREAVCVRVDGQWLDVPERAIVKTPNRYGPAVVWPMNNPTTGSTYIRCFLPGAGA